MSILITDFDGTFTTRDYFDLILEHHDSPAARESWRRFRAGEVSHFAGIAGVFAALRTDAAGADALIDALAPAPGTADAVHQLQAAGWEIIIASAGCRWYIDRLLARLGVSCTVHASPGHFSPAAGLIMEPATASPFYDPQVGIDKPAVVREALTRDAVVAYAGDSNTDRAASLLVPPERRFITSWLGKRFTAEGVPHVNFGRWPEIVAHLLNK